MKRREFIAGLGGAAASSIFVPQAARAQQTKMPVIGFLSSAARELTNHLVTAFRLGLKEIGRVEGENVTIEYRWAENQINRLPALAADLVGRRLAVIVTHGGTNSAQTAKAATTTIPIVFVVGVDPVATGLVRSLNRPGGNATGVSPLSSALGPKRLELLCELVPKASTIAALVNPNNSTEAHQTDEMLNAARMIGRQLRIVHASARIDFEKAFAVVVEQRAEALIIGSDGLFSGQREPLVALAARHAIPTIYNFRESTTAGGLISYGPSQTDAFRQAGVYTGRILKGEKPEDLPVVQPTKFELVINIKTAKALDLAVPATLLARADEVIE
jgi:putative tryptophan/tyrosine transport system substrate-binding protein